MKNFSLILFIGLLFVSIQAQNKLSSKDLEAIKQIEKNFEAAWLKNDEKGVFSVSWHVCINFFRPQVNPAIEIDNFFKTIS